MNSQKEKAEQFRKLHHSGKMLVLPNIWDPLGALLLENLEYPAIATASASIAFTNGYNDGENLPFSDVLTTLKKIAGCVSVPVTADIESGYASTEKELAESIEQIINTGIVGINFEDTDKHTKSVYPIEVQSKRISIIRKTADRMGIPLFINARTDTYIHGAIFKTTEAKFEETIKRGKAYQSAGADCFYPILLSKAEDIKTLLGEIELPVNILSIPGIPDLRTLNEMGVARLSLGPSFLKIAIKAMKELAVKLKNYDGLHDIITNEITSDYLENLVEKK